MKMTEEQIKSLSYGFAEWFLQENERDLDYEEDCVEDLFNEYAEYLIEKEEMDDDELMTNMFAVVQYYGEEGYTFENWYEERTVDSADCVEYEEWKKKQDNLEQQEYKQFQKRTIENCPSGYRTVWDDPRGRYIDEDEDDECFIQYRKEIEDACPDGYETLWDDHGFKYEKKRVLSVKESIELLLKYMPAGPLRDEAIKNIKEEQ